MLSEYESFVRLILDNPADQTCRLVFADWLEEHNDLLHVGMRFVTCFNDGDKYDSYEYGNGDVGDGNCDDGGNGCGNGDGGGSGDGGNGYGDGYGDGVGGFGGFGNGKYIYKNSRENIKMEDGTYILSIRSSYVPYVLIGNVEVKGFDLIVTNGKIIRRFGLNYSLAQLATDGPAADTELLPASEKEIIFRPNVSRAIVVNKSKWKNHLTLGT